MCITHICTLGYCSIRSVESFDMVGPFDMFWSSDPVGSFGLVGPFEQDGLFE